MKDPQPTKHGVLEYSDVDFAEVSRKGCVGEFRMSTEDGQSFDVPFVYDARTEQLALHGVSETELASFRTEFLTDAKERCAEHRDQLRDGDVALTPNTFLFHASQAMGRSN
ncbi:MAG: hypothetical protein RLZZ450_103 [Pseudomonadota bacterium]